MSPISRTRNRRTGNLSRRLLAGAMAASAVAITGLPPRSVFAQNIVVSGGAVQSNSSLATYDSIDVSSTDGSGNPSTYNADAPLTLTGALTARDLGVFNVNADVSVGRGANASSGGVINLNTGTLAASWGLSFDGPGAVNQNGGHYSVDRYERLTLSNGAALTYGTGDTLNGSVDLASGAALTLARDLDCDGISITGTATSLASAGYTILARSLSVTSGAAVTLDQNLTLTSDLSLWQGGAIARTSQTISASAFSVGDATLDLLAGDTFSGDSSSDVWDGGLVNAPAGTTLGDLEVAGTNGNGDRSTFNVNGDVSLRDAGAFSDGVINLNTGTLSAEYLFLDGNGALNQNGGHYAIDWLDLASGAAIRYGTGDSITTSVAVYWGATLSLDRDLSLTADFYLGPGSSIDRTSETISARSFTVDDATLDLLASDTFSPSSNSAVQNGAVVNAPAGTALGGLIVSGTNGNGDRAMFNVNGNITLTSAAVASNGVLNLIAGTLSAPSLSFAGVGSAGQSGGHYDVTNLSLTGGTTLSFGLGDSIDSLFISDAGSRLDGLAPLTLASLSLTNGGILNLGDFTGTGAIADWGLRMAGDDTFFLKALIRGGRLTAGLFPLSVIFDADSSMTYVIRAVPEIDPNTAHGAVVLLVGALGLLERRLRQATLPRRRRRSATSGRSLFSVPLREAAG